MAKNRANSQSKKRYGKSKKKRTKRYSGEDAKTSGAPTKITRITAVKKSPLREWWEAKKQSIKISAILATIVFFIGYALFALATWVV